MAIDPAAGAAPWGRKRRPARHANPEPSMCPALRGPAARLNPWLMASLMTLALPALAGNDWSAVGSVGTPDEASAATVDFSGQYARIRSTAPAATTVVLRYDLVNTWDADDRVPTAPRLQARFLDNGASARVKLTLRGYHRNTGVTSLLTTLDSAGFPGTGYQTQWSVPSAVPLDFATSVYWVEAELSRTDTTGNPTVAAIAVAP